MAVRDTRGCGARGSGRMVGHSETVPKRVSIRIAVVFLAFVVSMPALSQVQPPLDVEAFGARSEELPKLRVPPNLRQFIPEGTFLHPNPDHNER